MSTFFRKRLLLFIRVVSVLTVLTVGLAYKEEIFFSFKQLSSVGWSVLLIFPLFGIWNYAAACGWHGLVEATPRDIFPSKARLFIIRLEAQAINIIAPLMSVGGEILKTYLITEKRGQITSTPSVILDIISSAIAGLTFSLLGASLYFTSVSVEPRFFLFILSAFFALLILLYWHLWLRLFNKISIFSRISSIKQVLFFLEDSSSRFSKPFRRAIMWHLIERILTGGEILIIAWSLGYHLRITEALFAAAIMSGFTLFLFFIPAQIGAAEGGLALAFSILGLPPNLGLSVALARRARQVFTFSIGLSILITSEGLKIPQGLSFIRSITNGVSRKISFNILNGNYSK